MGGGARGVWFVVVVVVGQSGGFGAAVSGAARAVWVGVRTFPIPLHGPRMHTTPPPQHTHTTMGRTPW
jgi:hypothetical protein